MLALIGLKNRATMLAPIGLKKFSLMRVGVSTLEIELVGCDCDEEDKEEAADEAAEDVANNIDDDELDDVDERYAAMTAKALPRCERLNICNPFEGLERRTRGG